MALPKIILCLMAITAAAVAQSASPFLGGAWTGNVTPTTATVAVRLNASALRVRLQVSTNPGLTSPIFSPAVNTAASSGNAVKLSVQGLLPDTDYFYGIEVANTLRTETISRGRFRTFPLGRASFKIAFGGDGDYRALDQSAYAAIVAERPLMFLHLGDLHYNDTNTTNIEDYRTNYDSATGEPSQSAMFRALPIAYIWGDHDYCGDNSDGTSVGRDTARAAYKERVPHYPLAANVGGALAQAFTVGRVRIILTDTRSASVSSATKESASKSRLGASQKAWFKQELISARDAGFPLIIWMNPDPWIDTARLGADTWGGYATERTELANFIRDNRVTNVVMLSADMHALAFDDGTNSDYATGGGAPITVLHAASLTSAPNVKGGPYAVGPILGSQQYGILEIYDNGGPSVACRFQGIHVGESPKITQIFSSSAAGAKEHALVNISTLARVTATDSLVSGFVISSSTNRNVLVRAIGPTLSAFGVGDALARPVLSVFQGDQLVGSNSAWSVNSTTGGGPTVLSATNYTEGILDAFDRAGAFRLVDDTSRDAALVLSLAPGSYTVQVKSGDGNPGATLLEVYDLP
jgi:phosphodiesterase/alkaline phosphatase D-like protein